MKPKIVVSAILIFAVASGFYWYRHHQPSPTGEPSKDTSGLMVKPSVDADMPAAPSTEKYRETEQHSRDNVVDSYTLAGSDDYAALEAHYEAAAKAGDPYARRVIAQIYDFCAGYLLNPAGFGSQFAALAVIRPEAKPQLDAVQSKTAERCAGLDDGAAVTHDWLEARWADAVASGDPVATLMVAEKQPDLRGAQLDQLLDHVLKDADPETLYEVGNLIAVNQSFDKYADVADPYLGRFAWQIVACQRGGMALCGPNAPLTMSMCANGICMGADFEQAVRASIPGPDQARLNALISRIQQFLLTKG